MKTPEALRAVDEALASGRAGALDPAEREFQEIALALRADAPPPDPAFVRALEQRVARGFAGERRERVARRLAPGASGRRSPGGAPTEGTRRHPEPRPPIARSLLARRRLALAGLASLLAVVAIGGAVAGLSGGGGSPASRPLAAPAESLQGGGDAAAPQSLDEAPPPAAGAARSAGAPRRVERDAQLTLAAPPSRLDRVADRIVDVTDRHRGVVLDSSLSTGDDAGRGGSFSLRVPTGELTATLRDLSRLGDVRARSQSGHDVTGTYSSLTDRLASARLERRAIQRRLAHAGSTGEADRLRARLDQLSQEVHALSGQVTQLRRQTSSARIAVTLIARRAAASPLGGADDALRGSLRALVDALAITLRVVAAVLPFALLGALAWASAAAVRRRRREAALS